MRRLGFLFLFLGLFAFVGMVKAQNSSNKGKDFYVAYSTHIDGLNSRMTLFLSADQVTTYEVFVGANLVSSGTISANSCLPVVINANIPGQDAYINSSNQIERGKAIRVLTNQPISLYSIISNSQRTGGTMILPTNTLGKDYYTYSYKNQGSRGTYAYFTIIATEDDTEIEIVPTGNERYQGHVAYQSFRIPVKLMKGDIYQYQSEPDQDLSGSYIKSLDGCKPIAVFSGNNWAAFCEDENAAIPSGGDNLYQQLFPVSSWGKKFVTAPFYNVLNGNQEIFRIIVANNNTVITVNGSTTNANGVPLSNPYQKGDVITFASTGANVISASLPISVAQYQTSQTCNPSNPGNNNPVFPGDPEITVLNPIEQTLTNITVFSKLADVGVPTRISKYYINVIIKTADAGSFRIDGNQVSNFTRIDNEYSYAIIDVTNMQSQHRLTAAGGFSAIAYGMGTVESYAYLAGANIQDFTFQPISSVTRQNLSSACLGEPVTLMINLPYKATKLRWEIEGQPIISEQNPQSVGTLTKDDVLFYTFAYPNQLQYPTPGTYQFKVTAEKPTADQCGNTEELITDFTVDNKPTASFKIDVERCQGYEIQFTDQSTSNSPVRNIVKWNWDFGDGKFSDEQHPKHAYDAPGTYNVVLTVSTNTACSISSDPVSITIKPTPVALFEVLEEICVGKELKLKDQSTIAEGTIKNYHWDFGNGQQFDSPTPVPPVFKYSTSGKKTIKLIVTSDLDCASRVFSKEIEVNGLPKADFSMPGYCLDDGVAKFNNLSKNEDGTSSNISYLWDFGDQFSTESPSSQTTGAHRFSRPGLYTITLRVFNQFGCEGEPKTAQFLVNPYLTKADFSVANENGLCSGQPVVIQNKSTITAPGKIVKVEVYPDYVNQPTSFITVDYPENQDITLNYPEFGGSAARPYQIRMVAYSGEKCFLEVTKTVYINPIPKLQFDPIAKVCVADGNVVINQAKETMGMAGKGTYSGKGIVDELTGLFNPTVAGVGTFPITYTFVSDNAGVCTRSITANIVVEPSPTVSSERVVYMLSGGEVRLPATATGNGLTYNWTPATGLSQTNVQNPLASPSKDTAYEVVVTNDLGCSASTTVMVRVLENVEVPNSFSPNDDSVNDVWNIKYLATYPKSTVAVFDRSGTRVFYSLGYQVPFDGKYENRPLPVGVYYYIVNPGNGRKLLTGPLTIIR